jgi:hypothetical protein
MKYCRSLAFARVQISRRPRLRAEPSPLTNAARLHRSPAAARRSSREWEAPCQGDTATFSNSPCTGKARRDAPLAVRYGRARAAGGLDAIPLVRRALPGRAQLCVIDPTVATRRRGSVNWRMYTFSNRIRASCLSRRLSTGTAVSGGASARSGRGEGGSLGPPCPPQWVAEGRQGRTVRLCRQFRPTPAARSSGRKRTAGTASQATLASRSCLKAPRRAASRGMPTRALPTKVPALRRQSPVP